MLEVGEDDDTGAGLEEALDHRLDLLTDEVLGVIDDHHSAIRKITHALTFVFAFTRNAEVEHFTREHDGAHGFGNVVEIDVVDGLEFSDFAQVVVVGEEFGVQVPGEANEFAVDFLFVGEIAVMDFDFVPGIALDAVEDFEATAAAGAFDGVVGIGDLLEFFEDESRDDNEPFEEIAVDEVGDAAIDDDAGIEEEEVVGFIARSKADVRDDEGEVFLVAPHGEHDADVAEAEKEAEADEPAGRIFGVLEQTRTVDEQGDNSAEEEAEGGGGEGAERETLEHFIHGNHQPAEAESDDHAKGA